MSRTVADADRLPAAGDLEAPAAELRACAEDPKHARAFAHIRALAAFPPRVLLLEGGSARERSLAALYWAMVLNCAAAARAPAGTAGPLSAPRPQEGFAPLFPQDGPCCVCASCLRMLARMHRDLFYLDGLAGTISIDEVRAVRAVLGEPPREARRRAVILAEAQALSEAAANAMLKSLEETRTDTVFVLLAPQRERLLPTLVSRSWVLTLAWPDPHAPREGGAEDQAAGWAECAARFLRTGHGLFERTGARGGVDAAAAGVLILACQRALAAAMAGTVPEGGAAGAAFSAAEAELIRFFADLPPNRQRMADSVLAEGQDSVIAQVNAALAVDWVMTRLYLLRPRR